MDDPRKDGLTLSRCDWSSIGIRELLSHDRRPCFIVDLGLQPPSIVFRNPACEGDGNGDGVLFKDLRMAPSAFYEWITSFATSGPPVAPFIYSSLSWTATVLRGRWKVVSGHSCTTPVKRHGQCAGRKRQRASSAQMEAERHIALSRPPGHRQSNHDWTTSTSLRNSSPYVDLLRSWDWSKTLLGPMESWSAQLRLVANLVITDPNPAALFWGQELAGLYNEPYTGVLHDKHPDSLGEPARETWAEVYANPEMAADANLLWEAGRTEGRTTRREHQCYFLRNGGRLEEKFFNLSMFPIFGSAGETIGFYQTLTDITADQLNQRRQACIRRVGELTAGEDDLPKFFSKISRALEENVQDVPFALLYSLHLGDNGADLNSSVSELFERGAIRLESSLGVPSQPVALPLAQELLLANTDFLNAFEAVCRSSQPHTLRLEPYPGLVQCLSEDPPSRGFGDRLRDAVLCPIEPITHSAVSGVLFMGINPRRPYDADYQLFVKTLGRTISSSLASVLLVIEQRHMVQAATKRTEEATQMERRAKAMMDISPVGHFLLSLEGQLLYVNKAWYEITDYEHSEFHPMSWLSCIAEDEIPYVQREWFKCIGEGTPASLEIRLKKEWTSTDPATGDTTTGPTYILLEAAPHQIGGTTYISGTLTDISRQKWAEGVQKRQRDEAVELKRQQENFIDMTSHEMRNPLSAIFQCADDIVSALLTHRQSEKDELIRESEPYRTPTPKIPDSPITHAIESANTIMLCAQHQKRIVDDVLILSKVDADLVKIIPIAVQPKALLESTMRIFAAELKANDASMRLDIDNSFQTLQINWVKLDPGRLSQVLINLCTNAIKFMDSAPRKITLGLGASIETPKFSTCGVEYLKGQAVSVGPCLDPTNLPEWGQGEAVYLQFEVTDTGCGMSEESINKLFQRFSQPSPRTHTQYGGSGLGLFIARHLTRLQGGEIGVTSHPGQGSTFAFYIKVRRTESAAIPASHSAAIACGSVSASATSLGLGAESHTRARIYSKFSILLVEDNLVNQKVLKNQLRKKGFQVDVADNGRDVLEYLRNTRYWRGREQDGKDLSLILMDIEMPIMSGTEATKNIRKMEAEGSLISNIPIIAITANARSEQVDTALQSGMDDVISKPFRISELVHKMELFL